MLKPALPLISPIVESGGERDSVSESSLSYLSVPNALAAAICNVTAWTETLMVGRAMRSAGVKSATPWMRGSREFSRKGCELSAEIPLISSDVPLVFAHSVIRAGTPPAAISTEVDISASVTAAGGLEAGPALLQFGRA